MTTFDGGHGKPAGSFAVVAARFNEVIADGLVAGA